MASWLKPTADSSKGFAEHRVEQLRLDGYAIDICTQHAGDLVFVPGLWHHATLNLAETVAVAWRERFVESPLDVAADKWKARLGSNGNRSSLSLSLSLSLCSFPLVLAGTVLAAPPARSHAC